MKSLSVRLGVILIGLAIFGNAEVWGADWKLYYATDKELFFYDTESISYPSEDVIKVWTKIVGIEKESDKGFSLLGKSLGELFNGKDEFEKELDAIHKRPNERRLSEIKCEQRMFRLIRIISYDKDGAAIKDYLTDNAPWSHIPPETRIELLFKTVCK